MAIKRALLLRLLVVLHERFHVDAEVVHKLNKPLMAFAQHFQGYATSLLVQKQHH